MISFAELTALVEALLFVSERPVPAKELAAFIDHTSEDQVKEAISGLANRYAMAASGLQVETVAGGFRLSTRPELGEEIKEFFRIKNRQKLSRAALETCAIIAYKQPITNPEIQEIRAVSADGVLRTLLERRLIRIVGRKDTVGKPLLYGTTKLFLEHFGLATLDELPAVEEFGDLMGDDSSEHLAAALDRLPGADGTAILPLEDAGSTQDNDAGAAAASLDPPPAPTDEAGAGEPS